MAILPDPTVDLDWSGYVGSIQGHFSKNARAHPDRTCVVETATSQTPERTFTYKQIYEASNTLAHYLHDAGVTNDDVVMIWAHRSVDLVVSIMGTLASAATISILDPAYPPARQKIYLEVAQPCALVNIARATDEAGPLAPLVRKYIDEELNLKAEVPSLLIDDDGVLSGGKVHGMDVFDNVRSKSADPPNALVGPDSNPTLSFTSGSEGRPKGVLGRHYSLAYYFSWMAERFQLNERSKFTLLSGIAHDPVQRDIFTPLFLGAQLLVPSKEDIQHERLAEWMRDHKPTVTHLTPAMGQILVGGATAEFDSLDRAFFVGDVLTKRDCKSLRDLAVNVNIVNMYGTTETQRAVSYYEIPSRAKDPISLDSLKDTIPAGQGMKNVQLLVVNREDRHKLCGVGEVGEIYVRAAGLAEGYKGDKALNNQKFLVNWFTDTHEDIQADQQNGQHQPDDAWRRYYHGPRDRLYRTGDLGRYTESGNVECTGRADDQVKIRGFRIELNDIDSNLSQSPLIRDCKTLVRRDRNEEPKLVSYIVPELKEYPQWLAARGHEDVEDEGRVMGATRVYSQRFGPLQDEVREHLKERLPAYAVPTLFIVLDKLPLNPNGKVDKPNLPFPDIAEQTKEASEDDIKTWNAMTDTEKLVADQWAKVISGLNPKTLKPNNDFFDLGGHSILAQQMLLNVRRAIKADVSINGLYEHSSLADFSREIDRRLKTPNGVNGAVQSASQGVCEYSQSLAQLSDRLDTQYQSADVPSSSAPSPRTIFLTGATGFLGSYLIKDILDREAQPIKLIAHVRNARDTKAALERLQRSLRGYGLWRDERSARLSCVVGDLAKPKLGLDESTWLRLSQEVDAVIHNGATVHWVRRYQDLLPSNVLSTIDAMRLCNEGKPKIFTFVSSTSVLDSDHYIDLSHQQSKNGQDAITEADDLEGSASGLGTGYGQTKWVSERLVRAAGSRGLRGSIVRPGYVLGDSETGVCNTDDFLIRLLKGCIQLSARPHIANTVNAVPVNHVARVVVAATLNPLENGVNVVHVTGHPRHRMFEYLSYLEYYGFVVPETSYEAWKDELEKYVSAGGQEKDQEQHALMPLYHFCINDLPANTRAPELKDENAVRVLKKDADVWTGVDESAGYDISKEVVGRYLRFLVETGFVMGPTGRGRALPKVELSAEQMKVIGAVGGRGGNAKL